MTFLHLQHDPVLLKETLEMLALQANASVVDGTLGLGGHAATILEKIGPKGNYYGFDLDEENLSEAKRRLKFFSSQITTFHDNFAHCQNRLQKIGVSQVDAILLDLGLSSPHIDEATRGFSIQKEGPLDMRFDRSQGESAADIVNHWPQEELKRIFYEYGEERYAPKMASLIVDRRKDKMFETTFELMDLIGEIMKSPGDKRRMATRIFQALRIAVNDELQVLKQALPTMLSMLAPGGRMVVISYHSLEDRLVKQSFREAAKICVCPSEMMRCECAYKSTFKIITKKPITPSSEEILANPRSRSAKLRAIQRINL